MRLLFEMDKRDYDNCTHRFVRNSARSIIIREKKIAMIHSLKYDYYKFPGGGMEGEESPVRAMIRETREEAGLVVRPDTVKEYGYVHRIQKSDKMQRNALYRITITTSAMLNETVAQCLDNYEAMESFTLEFVEPHIAIQKNRNVPEQSP